MKKILNTEKKKSWNNLALFGAPLQVMQNICWNGINT